MSFEKQLQIETKKGVLRGVVHYPDRSEPRKNAIVFFHGYFSSDHIGPARLYLEIARKAAKIGFQIYRFDCLGVGDSDGSFEEVTFNSELQDYHNICSYVFETTKKKLVIIGHSMGANLALFYSSTSSLVNGLILIAPDIENKGGIENLFRKNQWEELIKTGTTFRKGLQINLSFIETIREKTSLEIANQIIVPTFVFQGTKDEFYAMLGAEKLVQLLPQGQLIKIQGGDHNFFNKDARHNVMEEVLKSLESIECN